MLVLVFFVYFCTIEPDKMLYGGFSLNLLPVVGTSSGSPNLHVPSAPKTNAAAALVPSDPTTPPTVSDEKATPHAQSILEFVQSDMVKSQGIQLEWIAMRMER